MSENNDIALLRQEVAELKTAVDELVLAFNTARGVVKFVRYLSATVVTISAAIGAVWGLFHMGATK